MTSPASRKKRTPALGHDYCATAFQTIASLAARCLDEKGIESHDILFAIQKMSEGLAKELDIGLDTAEGAE